jgi:TRAP-type mannitol/chloroaromatic compound transport system permease small subunit
MLSRIISTIDAISEWTGRISSWLVMLLVAITIYDVSMRWAFSIGSVALQELEWHLFAAMFLLGAAYTLKHDGHVRVDILYQSNWAGPRYRAWVDFLGSLLFLIPFCLLIMYSSRYFVYNAYAQGEISPDPGGLHYRWLIKAMIPLGFGLLLLQGVAEMLRNLQRLLRHGEQA